MLAIINYGGGNLGSVENACAYLGFAARTITEPEGLEDATAVILPGQGAFGDCMNNLRSAGFEEPVKEWISADKPLLGICVGLQILFEGSVESPGVPGLGIFEGVLDRFEPGDGRKVPQMGWNRCRIPSASAAEGQLFAGVPDGSHFYFVHSFYAPLHPAASAVADYGLEYTAAISRGRLHATQFHPEKSQTHGKQLLRNFYQSTLQEIS